MRDARLLSLSAFLATTLACSSPTSPTAPTATAGGAYAEEVLGHLERHSYRTNEIAWEGLRLAVQQQTRNAHTPADAERAINVVLQSVADHSIYIHMRDGGAAMSVASACADASWDEIGPRPGIGYVVVYTYEEGFSTPVSFAQEIQDSIAAQDRADLDGWIVDLRGVGGTSIWPALAGLGPLLGEGTVASSVDASGQSASIDYRNGSIRREGETKLTVPRAHRMKQTQPRIAVLTSRFAQTGGQAAALAFKGRANVRFFGTATCSVPAEYRSFTLSDGATLHVAAATMQDRRGRTYPSGVTPDETIASPDAVAARAIEWIRSGS